MYQDYLLRMIQQLGGFVAGILHLRQGGRNEEALVAIGEGYGRFTGLSASLVHAISEEDLVQLLRARGGIDAERGLALAELLREEAETWDAMGREDESYPRYLKSARLYVELIGSDEEIRSRDLPGFARAAGRLSSLDLPPATRDLLLPTLEAEGHYDLAENILANWEGSGDPEAARQAAAFYNRLLDLDDAALIAGGLTRGEVLEGLRALQP